MTAESLAQARSSQARLGALANELASGGLLAAAEIVAGGALTLARCLAELAPPEQAKPPLELVPQGEKAGG